MDVEELDRLIKNFKKYRYLLFELTKKNIKLKYRRSYLGILWTLLEPIMTTFVLAIVFTRFRSKNDPAFPVYILTGRLLYSFFSQSTKQAMKSIRSNSGMIKGICSEVHISIIKCFINLYYFYNFHNCLIWCYDYI